ncbi:MAG: hypothetical protein MI862_26030 [Desulfobacterales bacterium]|nr:hypothetical protein [Desulfobacterales bacterium]
MAETLTEMIAQGQDITTTLSEIERVSLNKYEKVISKGLHTFFEVGQALAEIRDRRLYRETHKTFEKYCREVWDLSRGRVYQQISGYETVALLESKMSTIVDKNKNPVEDALGISPEPKEIVLPINEAQARPITKFKDPDEQVKAWQMVLQKLNENPKAKLTASLVSKTVKEMAGVVAKKKVAKTKKKVETTSLLSKNFKYAHQTMLDVIEAEKNTDWATSKRKEVIKWLKALVKIAESDD